MTENAASEVIHGERLTLGFYSRNHFIFVGCFSLPKSMIFVLLSLDLSERISHDTNSSIFSCCLGCQQLAKTSNLKAVDCFWSD